MEIPHSSRLGVGGEHEVFGQILETEDRVLKVTLSGYYGRTIDEDQLFDPRTFQNVIKLKLRNALPCEYLARWALLELLFGMKTRFEGVCLSSEPRMAISQLFIGVGTEMPSESEVEALMLAMNFVKVDSNLIINPENADCTWYRRDDGILITDAFPRNFRVDAETGAILPVDLMVNLIPPGISKILPSAIEPFTLPAVQPYA